MRITPHFTLDEMTVSQLAAREGLDNNPPAEARANLQLLCNALEQVRALFGAPVIVSSGYRSPAVNQRIGGTLTSKHRQGLAADFTVIEVTPVTGYYWDTKHGSLVAATKMLIGAAIGKTLDDSVEGRLNP